MEAILARGGLRREAGQTPAEFATAVGPQIVERTGNRDLVGLPSQIVDAYYQIRSGHLPLDSTQAKAVEQALNRLATLNRPKSKPADTSGGSVVPPVS